MGTSLPRRLPCAVIIIARWVQVLPMMTMLTLRGMKTLRGIAMVVLLSIMVTMFLLLVGMACRSAHHLCCHLDALLVPQLQRVVVLVRRQGQGQGQGQRQPPLLRATVSVYLLVM